MTYYEILGVDRNATAQEIKKAYRRLAKKWHPDLNRDNVEVAGQKMREINIAYDTLSKEVSRIDYDKKLDAEAARSAGAKKSARQEEPKSAPKTSRRTSATSSGKVDFNGIHDSFESFFGFNPKTHEVTDADKLNTFTSNKKKKNPLDTTDFFEKFMGIKR